MAETATAIETALDRVIAEPARLAAVEHTGLLDTPPDEGFDRLTRLAAKLTGAPVTVVTLIDRDRDFYVSQFGFVEPLATMRQMSGRTFCHHTLISAGPLVINDTTVLPQHAAVPTVHSLGLRAYLGIPLVDEAGAGLGSFCAIDFAPRQWRQLDIEVMEELALSALREITLRRALADAARAEERRHQEEEQFRLAFMFAPIGKALVSLDGRWIAVNPATCRMLGYTEEELLATDFQSLTHPDDLPADLDQVNQLLGGEIDSYEMQKRYMHREGHEVIALLSVSLVRQPDGAPMHFISQMQDISARVRLEQRAAEHAREVDHLNVLLESRAREAEAANRAKSTFLANMSHEIRTPLNGILGMAHLLRLGPVTPEQARQLDTIALSGRHLLAVINDILDFSMIEADRLVLAQSDFTVDDFSRSVHAVIDEGAKAKGLQLTFDLSGLPPVLHGDVTRLSQCAVNYLSNALKFTTHGTVLFQGETLADDQDGVLLRFTVSDTGIGIPADRLATLFQPFRQVDASMTRRHGGTGLGLAITRHLAQRMGGDAGATSEPGQGSRFWFTARLARGASPATQLGDPRSVEAQLRAQYRGRRVLLVEDEPVSREMAAALLENAGLQVALAENGEQAVRMAATATFDAIVMDMQMPLVNGLEATRAIRAGPGGNSAPIIALTANAFIEDRTACLAAGMDDFLAKPIQPGMLYEKLLRWLQSGRQAAA